jgi:hypothetical protein
MKEVLDGMKRVNSNGLIGSRQIDTVRIAVEWVGETANQVRNIIESKKWVNADVLNAGSTFSFKR